MRINSVPDVNCFCNNKNVLRAQSMVWHFVRHPVYNSTFFFQLGVKMEVDVQRHAPADLPPGTTLYSFDRMLGGLQGQSGEMRKISPHWNSIP